MRQSSAVLGLDLGSTSVGWALVDQSQGSILGIGTRIFDPGVDSAEKFARGGEESRSRPAPAYSYIYNMGFLVYLSSKSRPDPAARLECIERIEEVW